MQLFNSEHAGESLTSQHETMRVDDRSAGSSPNIVGDYLWKSEAAPQLDFAQLTLNDDGTYTASVNATLVNPRVQSFHAPCMLPEQGLWSIYEVQGKTKLRIRPTTSRARVYGVVLVGDQLSIGRRGESTVLFRELVTLGQVA